MKVRICKKCGAITYLFWNGDWDDLAGGYRLSLGGEMCGCCITGRKEILVDDGVLVVMGENTEL